MVGVVSRIDGTSGTFTCSATILPNFNIVTAAHCVLNAISVTLIFGTVNLISPYRTLNVSSNQVHIHPGTFLLFPQKYCITF